jgi:ComF family protein
MLIQHKINSFYDAMLALLYPQTCAACGAGQVEARANAPCCAACWMGAKIFTGEEAMCWKCSRILASSIAPISEDEKQRIRCHVCDDLHFTAARAAGIYAGALRASVLNLKREPFIGARLVELLCKAQSRAPLNTATRIVPIPLHPLRERERGFNQAVIIARALAARVRLPFDDRSLIRTAHTARHRAGMDARARRETVEDAFEIRRPRLIENETILLIDDVFTTGATASVCAKALREAGAKEIYVLTIARAV